MIRPPVSLLDSKQECQRQARRQNCGAEERPVALSLQGLCAWKRRVVAGAARLLRGGDEGGLGFGIRGRWDAWLCL